jgi:hypothetical protein
MLAKRLHQSLIFFDPLYDIVGEPYKDKLYENIGLELSLILHNCYNATDLQFKLDDIVVDLCPPAKDKISRHSLYVIASDMWKKIKENPEIK